MIVRKVIRLIVFTKQWIVTCNSFSFNYKKDLEVGEANKGARVGAGGEGDT